ncbi:hypothetical protein [Mycobacterium paragordonae]|uniref:hypothetical protein n=1 Tax=Mycobacterium paragordonae TaxID=1389713 RepID=UPI0012E1C026|nr:hypothetical protein [Mycobacterium paragordonae]
MAHINNAVLIAQVALAADRANFVRQDPTVVKAAKQAFADVGQAGRSVVALVGEAHSSWQRHGRR